MILVVIVGFILCIPICICIGLYILAIQCLVWCFEWCDCGCRCCSCLENCQCPDCPTCYQRCYSDSICFELQDHCKCTSGKCTICEKCNNACGWLCGDCLICDMEKRSEDCNQRCSLCLLCFCGPLADLIYYLVDLAEDAWTKLTETIKAACSKCRDTCQCLFTWQCCVMSEEDTNPGCLSHLVPCDKNSHCYQFSALFSDMVPCDRNSYFNIYCVEDCLKLTHQCELISEDQDQEPPQINCLGCHLYGIFEDDTKKDETFPCCLICVTEPESYETQRKNPSHMEFKLNNTVFNSFFCLFRVVYFIVYYFLSLLFAVLALPFHILKNLVTCFCCCCVWPSKGTDIHLMCIRWTHIDITQTYMRERGRNSADLCHCCTWYSCDFSRLPRNSSQITNNELRQNVESFRKDVNIQPNNLVSHGTDMPESHFLSNDMHAVADGGHVVFRQPQSIGYIGVQSGLYENLEYTNRRSQESTFYENFQPRGRRILQPVSQHPDHSGCRQGNGLDVMNVENECQTTRQPQSIGYLGVQSGLYENLEDTKREFGGSTLYENFQPPPHGSTIVQPVSQHPDHSRQGNGLYVMNVVNETQTRELPDSAHVSQAEAESNTYENVGAIHYKHYENVLNYMQGGPINSPGIGQKGKSLRSTHPRKAKRNSKQHSTKIGKSHNKQVNKDDSFTTPSSTYSSFVDSTFESESLSSSSTSDALHENAANRGKAKPFKQRTIRENSLNKSRRERFARSTKRRSEARADSKKKYLESTEHSYASIDEPQSSGYLKPHKRLFTNDYDEPVLYDELLQNSTRDESLYAVPLQMSSKHSHDKPRTEATSRQGKLTINPRKSALHEPNTISNQMGGSTQVKQYMTSSEEKMIHSSQSPSVSESYSSQKVENLPDKNVSIGNIVKAIRSSSSAVGPGLTLSDIASPMNIENSH